MTMRTRVCRRKEDDRPRTFSTSLAARTRVYGFCCKAVPYAPNSMLPGHAARRCVSAETPLCFGRNGRVALAARAVGSCMCG
eukprot:scaffold14062_cov64-Phaeocystis_antarctica.AAC.1